jgi:hypothetical protein
MKNVIYLFGQLNKRIKCGDFGEQYIDCNIKNYSITAEIESIICRKLSIYMSVKTIHKKNAHYINHHQLISFVKKNYATIIETYRIYIYISVFNRILSYSFMVRIQKIINQIKQSHKKYNRI